MKRYKLKNGRLSVTDCTIFDSASAAELRVLLALIERNFEYSSEEELAKVAKTTRSRVISALTLFSLEEVIVEDDGEANITYEFNERKEDKAEKSSLELARSVRDDELKELFEECAALMNQAALPH